MKTVEEQVVALIEQAREEGRRSAIGQLSETILGAIGRRVVRLGRPPKATKQEQAAALMQPVKKPRKKPTPKILAKMKLQGRYMGLLQHAGYDAKRKAKVIKKKSLIQAVAFLRRESKVAKVKKTEKPKAKKKAKKPQILLAA
jgi:hypothetical protein